MILSMIAASCLMVVGFTLFQTIPHVFMNIFEASEEMLSIGASPFAHHQLFLHLRGGVHHRRIGVPGAGQRGVFLIAGGARQRAKLLPVAYLFSHRPAG